LRLLGKIVCPHSTVFSVCQKRLQRALIFNYNFGAPAPTPFLIRAWCADVVVRCVDLRFRVGWGALIILWLETRLKSSLRPMVIAVFKTF
jgi:hypothetical protein